MNRLKRLIGIGDREFYSTLGRLSLPIIVQNGLAALLYLVDNIMIGFVGEAELAAVGAADQLYFLLVMFTFGISGGAGIFAAQYWGRRDAESIHRVHGMALAFSVAISLAFIAIGVFGGRFVLGIYSHDPVVIDLGVRYLRIVCIGYLFQSISVVYLCVLRSCGNVVLTTLSSGVSIAVSLVLDYILIFGKLGFPAMGVIGAAIATCIAAFAGMVVVIGRSYAVKNVAAAKLCELLGFDLALFKGFLRVSMPVFVNEMLWSLGTSLFAALYGALGTQAIAASQIHATMDRIAFVVFIGVGNACAIMIGNRIGEKRHDAAEIYAKRFLMLGVLFGAVVGTAVVLAAPAFVSFYNVSDEVKAMAANMIRVFGCFIWLFVSNFIAVIGIMRAGGDTLRSSAIDITGLWLVSVPLACIAALVFKLPVWLVYACFIPGDIYKIVFGLRRILKGAWLNDLTLPTAINPGMGCAEIIDTHP